MIVAGGRTGADGADGAAAGASDFDVADRVLFVSEMLFSQSDGKTDGEKGTREGRGKKTYSSTAKIPTTGLARHAEGIPAARRSGRHAEGSHVRGGGHTALVCSSPQ